MKEERVLIVEDNSETLNYLVEILEDILLDYEISQAKTKEEAVKELKKNFIKLVILDLGIPARKDDIPNPENGFELLKEIKKNPKIQVIIITGTSKDATSVVRALKEGAFEYVIKLEDGRVENKSLLDTVKRALNVHKYVDIMEKEPTSSKEVEEVLQEIKIYGKYREELEEKHKGKFVAINFKTGEYIVNEDDMEVLYTAIERFGRGNFIFRRIGYDYVY